MRRRVIGPKVTESAPLVLSLFDETGIVRTADDTGAARPYLAAP
jgi:hypothetical protein